MNVTDAINTYKDLKIDKVGTVGDQLEKKLSRATIIGTFLFGFMLLARFSLVLVLLAIERNTRGQVRITDSGPFPSPSARVADLVVRCECGKITAQSIRGYAA